MSQNTLKSFTISPKKKNITENVQIYTISYQIIQMIHLKWNNEEKKTLKPSKSTAIIIRSVHFESWRNLIASNWRALCRVNDTWIYFTRSVTNCNSMVSIALMANNWEIAFNNRSNNNKSNSNSSNSNNNGHCGWLVPLWTKYADNWGWLLIFQIWITLFAVKVWDAWNAK